MEFLEEYLKRDCLPSEAEAALEVIANLACEEEFKSKLIEMEKMVEDWEDCGDVGLENLVVEILERIRPD